MRTVVQVAPYYPPHLGGIEQVVQHLAEQLSADYDVHVVTSSVRGAAPVPAAVNSPVGSPSNAVSVHRHRAIEVAHTVLAPGLPVSLLRAPRSAIIHVHVPHALLPEQVALAAGLRGQRYVVHFHGNVDTSGALGRRVLPLYKRVVFARVLRAAAGVVVLNATQAALVQDAYGVRPERVFIVPNGVGPEYYRPAPTRPPEPGELKLLFVGRLNVQKNVARLLDAISLTRQPVHLTIVGDGELRAPLTAQARRLGLSTGPRPRVRFTGSLYETDLVEAYHHADALVLSSDREGMPLVALEAMAAALPVIATDVAGNTELLHDTGLLAPPNARDLAHAIDRLTTDTTLRHHLALQSARAATAYTWTNVTDHIKNIYTHIYGPDTATALARPTGATL